MDFWGVFWMLAIWIPLILLWGFTLVDLFSSDHSGIAKALWAIGIIFLPIIGVILYFIFRPKDDPSYETGSGVQVGTTNPDPDDDAQVARLTDLNQRGLLGDEDYARIVTTMYR